MYTEHKHPGKYEGNGSELLAEIVHAASLDGSCDGCGDVTEVGWYASLVEGRRYGFVVVEDELGFVDVTVYDTVDEARAAYEDYELEAQRFYDEPDECEPDEGHTVCPCCRGEGFFLGQLGRVLHFRCRQCGMDYSWTLDAVEVRCE